MRMVCLKIASGLLHSVGAHVEELCGCGIA